MAAVEAGGVETVTILGSGPAGLTAAVYCARADMSPLVLEGAEPGGQLMITTDVENFPGFPEGVSGPELMERLRKQAERFGTRFKQTTVVQADFQEKPFTLTSADGQVIRTKVLIIAVGARAKWLGIPSEKRLMGKGVSACATCDGFFFRNMDVVVVGGGDTAIEEATYLTRFAKSVTVVHRRDTLRASKAMQEKALTNPKIKFEWNSAVDDILGEQEVRGVRLRDVRDNSLREVECQGVFIAIGHEPNTALFRSQLRCDSVGYIKVDPGRSRTNIAGVFAAGDAADPVYRQAITAAGTGCMAAVDAERFLESGERVHV